MPWRCSACGRYWGRCRARCPLCSGRVCVRMALRRLMTDADARARVLQFLGAVIPLPGTSLCRVGTARNCRCHVCRAPRRHDGHLEDRVMARLATAYGRGRAIPARWVHLLSGIVAKHPNHGTLTGLLIVVGCGRGPHATMLNHGKVMALYSRLVRPWVWRWMVAAFMPYVQDRGTFRELLGSTLSALLRIAWD